MPICLANTFRFFQYFINDTLQGYLDIFPIAYIDDVLVFSNLLSEHKKQIKLVLNKLRDARLQLDIAKSKFQV